jgi:hypothetical protein
LEDFLTVFRSATKEGIGFDDTIIGRESGSVERLYSAMRESILVCGFIAQERMETSGGIAPQKQIAGLLAEHAVRVSIAAVALSWTFWFLDCRRLMIGPSAPAFTMLILFLKLEGIERKVSDFRTLDTHKIENT